MIGRMKWPLRSERAKFDMWAMGFAAAIRAVISFLGDLISNRTIITRHPYWAIEVITSRFPEAVTWQWPKHWGPPPAMQAQPQTLSLPPFA